MSALLLNYAAAAVPAAAPQETFTQPVVGGAHIAPFVDIIYWINLDHRTDRRDQFLGEMKKLDFPSDRIIRVSGIYEKFRGHLGCSKSHILCLESFLKSSYKNCLIFEDDFEFVVSPEDIEKGFRQLSTVQYDVCMLSGSVYSQEKTQYPFLNKVLSATTTSGYLVSREFARVLLQNFRQGVVCLEDSYNANNPMVPYEHNCAIDQYWVLLQPENNWYIFNPKMGIQRGSHSDILGGKVDYKM